MVDCRVNGIVFDCSGNLVASLLQTHREPTRTSKEVYRQGAANIEYHKIDFT